MLRVLLTMSLCGVMSASANLQQPSARVGAPSVFPDDARLREIIRARVEGGRAAGIVLGVIDAEGASRIVAYGNPGPGAKPLGPTSVFEIGSITKVFTATVLAKMVARREINLETPVQTYAPVGLILPERSGKPIRVGHLAMHNSGLPRLPSNLPRTDPTNPYADYTVEQLYEFVSGYKLTRDPGEAFEYSNLGVGLLGHVLAARTRMSYEELVRQRVLKPLSMRMTGINLTPAMKEALAKGHDRTGKVTPKWDTPTLAGAGALRSNMIDMLKFLDANLGVPKNGLERAMRDAQAPRAAAGETALIGLNWITQTTSGGVTIVWHNGSTGGYSSFLGLDPKRQVGVVLLANQTGANDDIARHLLDPTLPLTPQP